MTARGRLPSALVIGLIALGMALGSAATACKDRERDAAKVDAASAESLPLAPPPPSSPIPGKEMVLLPSFAPIVKKADPSVVTVQTLVPADAATRRKAGRGVGTGFIFDRDGVILTNAHVVDEGNVTVRLSDDRELPAKIAGRDEHTDIAVLTIDAHDLPVASLGDSDAVEVGDWVLAIGNPYGLAHTVSVGIVSAKGRTREDVPLDPAGYYDFLQTDASINPGNSGGPLLDLSGRVVGMNTAIRGGGAQGIGFAIPINMVKQLLPKLIRDGKIVRSALGVRIRDLRELTKDERDKWNLDGERDASAAGVPRRGAFVDAVEPGGPAAEAGLRAGDVIVAFGDQAIERSPHLQWLASTAGVGQIVRLGVLREGTPKEVKVRLGELPEPKDPKRVGPDRPRSPSASQ